MTKKLTHASKLQSIVVRYNTKTLTHIQHVHDINDMTYIKLLEGYV